jgi:hypothetical protein
MKGLFYSVYSTSKSELCEPEYLFFKLVMELLKECILPQGEELNKFNAEALRDWNDTALLPCEHCGR